MPETRRGMRTLVIIVMFLMAACPAFTQTGDKTGKEELKRYLYEWTDGQGGVHITDDLGEVPERYRSKARTIEMPQGREVGNEGQPPGKTLSPEAATEGQETASKVVWQKRIRDWKNRLADAEKRYRDLDQKRLEALGSWGGVASGHLEGRVEAERIVQEMREVQLKIDEARNMIEVIIPEEARRAGIPPGWLRE